MREIKFRAWDGGKMRLPEYSDDEDFLITSSGEIKYLHEVGYERHNFVDYRKDNWVLMQYTGLKDKNGKEIYEGDILEHNLWGKTVIVWEHAMFRGQGGEIDVTLADHQLQRSRIIGNIYENPELLVKSNPYPSPIRRMGNKNI